MKKIFKMCTSILLSSMLLVGCSSTGKSEVNGENNDSSTIKEKIQINIASLKGPTTMGMVKIMEDAEKGQGANDYVVSMAGTADEVVTSMVKGEIDIATVPCNLASVLYNKTEGKVSIAAINTLGVLYMVESGDEISSIQDLKGKTIYTTGKGTTPEFILNYILTENGIDIEKDITIEYKSEATEVAALLMEDTNAIAMLPQPFVTTAQAKNENLKVVLDMTEEWDKVQGDNGSALVTGVVIVRNEFLEENKEAFDEFLKEYKASTEYVNANVKEAAALVEKYGIVNASVAEKALPLCNITYIDGSEMQEKVEGYLKVLFEQNPASVGGKLPAREFYYSK